METILSILVFILSLLIVIATLSSTVRIFVLPRSARDPIAIVVFTALRRLFYLPARFTSTYQARDRIMAFYAPVSLLALLPTWLTLILFGYAGMFRTTGIESWRAAFTISGSSLFTLGFAQGTTVFHTILTFTEATIGLILVALLIAYLPTMYNAFSRRERAVTLLEIRAGSPPSAVEMLTRYQRLDRLSELHEFWEMWEEWFAEIEESHTSLAALVFFRSPQPEHSWVTAAGAVLDAGALFASSLDVPRDPQVELCIRAGFIALRRIADFFEVEYNPNPRFPDDTICITRDEFDEAFDQLAEAGVPLYPDRDRAWQNFAGWRVNYDAVLLALARLTMAPYAPWISDRSPLSEGVKRKRRRWIRR